jgi:hypothetical protein
VDGPLLVDDEGLHGMVEKCRTTELTRGSHVIYIEGFQAGGGVGMIAKYSGPDTRGKKKLMRSGRRVSRKKSRYYSACDPTQQTDSNMFTMCMFRSEVGLVRIPRIRDADKGVNRLYFAGKGQLPVIDLHNLQDFRRYVSNTPVSNYAWAIFGKLKISVAGTYSLCITSDDGYFS